VRAPWTKHPQESGVSAYYDRFLEQMMPFERLHVMQQCEPALMRARSNPHLEWLEITFA
jgi:hypothetical protein